MTKRGHGMGEQKAREASPTAAWRDPHPPTPPAPFASHPRNLRPHEDRSKQ